MRQAIYILFATILLGFLLPGKVSAQEDEFKFVIDANFGVVPIKISAPMEVAKSGYSYIDSREVLSEPVYENVDTLGLLLNVPFHFGISVPIYKNENWSLGINPNVGFAISGNIRAAEGLSNYFYLDFPQFIYYKNYSRDRTYSALFGYKITTNVLPYKLFLIGGEIGLSETLNLRLFGSINSEKYYLEYTNGDIKPGITIREFGFGFSQSF